MNKEREAVCVQDKGLVTVRFCCVFLLLRKEVIQPQVLLRLPCYDLVLLTKHTLGASLPCGLGQQFRVHLAWVA